MGLVDMEPEPITFDTMRSTFMIERVFYENFSVV